LQIEAGKIGLGIYMSLLRCGFSPFKGQVQVLINALTGEVKDTEVILSQVQAGFSRFRELNKCGVKITGECCINTIFIVSVNQRRP
jgi:hypothetical protein